MPATFPSLLFPRLRAFTIVDDGEEMTAGTVDNQGEIGVGSRLIQI
jgi:hypothetical protein